MPEYVRCNLCGSDRTTLVAKEGDIEIARSFVKCKNCGLVYMSPRMTKEESKTFYKEHRNLSSSPLTSDQFDKKFVAREVERAKLVERFSPRCGKVLDIGCATGNFLRLLKSQGWQVLGIEPHLEYARYAEDQGLDIFAGTLDETDFADEYFDTVTLFHILEHLDNPLDSLQKIKRWLVPGGLCFIEVPNLNISRLNMGKAFYQAQFQENHNYIFSRHALQGIIEKAGFKIVRLRTSGETVLVPAGVTSGIVSSNKKLVVLLKRFLLRPVYKLTMKAIKRPLDILGMSNVIIAVAKKIS